MSASTHRFVMDELANRGTILEHTKVGEREERVVVREANNIVLYRLTTEPAGLAHGDAWGQEPLYTVDTVTRLCYSGRRTLVDCEALKREPALVPYITW